MADSANIAVLCPPLPGHLNPFATLGRALVKRGHRVIVFQAAAIEESVRAQGLEYCAIGKPTEELQSMVEKMGRLSGISSLRFVVKGAARLAEITCREGPRVLK